ncbi:MAG: 23S rRNA (uracil(1939)-C(5))-methyltransferase RlmD [Alicyclobacillaceae bacterium]|nr:23S rRNA (uracil(1939)-C(5))-methyltransferase RlmD [Alicyclobacillaceae bacterium]
MENEGVTDVANSQIRLKIGETVNVPVQRIGINGEGIGYHRKQVIFIPGALPGERVVVRVTDVERNFARGTLEKILRPSPHRRTPPCPVYERCGGCQLQHLAYEEQLRAKRELVVESFRRYTPLSDPPVREVLGMEEPWAYRNKAQFQVGTAGGRVVIGLYESGSHRLVDLTGCPVQHPAVNAALDAVRETLEEIGIVPCNERKGTGTLRTVVVRTGTGTGDIHVTLVTRTPDLPKRDALTAALRRKIPNLSGISQNINPSPSPLIFGPETRILWGDARLRERLGEREFWLSPRAFFQLNPAQTVKLYNTVREAAGLTGQERVVDAYCGAGTIALWLAPEAKEVRGMEMVPEAVQDARENARRAGFRHVRFEVGRAEDLLPRWVREGFVPDVIVVDPPRTGLAPSLIDTIARVRPRRLVYVSCNPSTLAKDCEALMNRGFAVSWIQPVDMFPQTSHVESVTLLALK